MLPNWLYGKSKSKLANILGGGGGTPADYNQVKAQVNQNTEDILLLNDALDSKAALKQITNPNILINPWFTVNQREFRTASSASNTYVADRWKVVSASGITITNGDDGIAIDNTNGADYVTIETLLAPKVSKSLLGREVTMSLSKVIGATDAYKTVTMPSTLPQSSTVIGIVTTEEYTLRTVITGSGHVKVDVQVKTGKSVTIRAIKLEIGDVSTLARDPRPEYAIELAKCRRYFYKTLQFDDNGANISPNQCLAVSTTRLQGIKFPAEMRANPTITINKVNELGSSTAITGVTSQWTSKEGISYFSIANATVGNLYIIDFEASAEL